MTAEHAPGQPGMAPRWTSSRKQAVGRPRNTLSRVWFTLNQGILTEIYYPRVDCACTRDLQFLVTDGREFFSEEKRDTDSEIRWRAPGVPSFEVTNRCKQGRYEIQKQILVDPGRHVLLQQIRFRTLEANDSRRYHLYVLLAPHLHNCGSGNTASVGDYKGIPMLFAEREDMALALACSGPWLKRSAGFVGVSDGWQDLQAHKEMLWEYARAENGNVALTAEIDVAASDGEFLLALGFGRSPSEGAHRARASLLDGFAAAWKKYREEWEAWQKMLMPLDSVSAARQDSYRVSTAVLSTHEATDFPGGIIASLSVPWGDTHGDKDFGGYHLVWPRDAYEACGAMLAARAHGEARRTLNYLEVTQEAQGHWPQNMWLDGTQYWKGLQNDETAAPILLLELARREGLLNSPEDRRRIWPMVRKAAAFIALNGPATGQDRWEETSGYSPYTLATEVTALLIAAGLAMEHGEPELGNYLRETADAWNDAIEDWTYATGTELARHFGVEGYYVRITPAPLNLMSSPEAATVPLKNQSQEESSIAATRMVSPDALALVRFGLRAPGDPRILNTIKVIDATLKAHTPRGPAWHRYTRDGYGEHADGEPFDGTGIGRAWPLLTGERAHYELAAGRPDEARQLLAALEAFADENGMIPEQIWDAAEIAERNLFPGRPSGSARPLVWAHAEHIKLLRSLQDGRVYDQPVQTTERYLQQQVRSTLVIWRFSCRTTSIPRGQKLRLETKAPAGIHWSDDNWSTVRDFQTRDTGIGVHVADLPTEHLSPGRKLRFTFYWPEVRRWEGEDFAAEITNPRAEPTPMAGALPAAASEPERGSQPLNRPPKRTKSVAKTG